MKELTFAQFKKFLVAHITSVVTRYKDKIKIWDIANELPSADANGLNLNLEQLLEILELVSNLVKKLQPEANRIINFSDIWAACSFIHDKPSVPPVYFLKLCEKKRIEYEAIGLQFYMGLKKDFSCRELLNISQTVDEFVQFGKTIHFSEMGFPSKHDVDPGCFFSSDHPEGGGYWHRRWDEKLQQEFLEKIVTIFASKPKAESIIWWDLTDNGEGKDIGSRFLTFSGLTRRDFSPKPALLSLQKFRKDRKF
jgi:GH35 family endo-1,4-beta-xylanase